MPNLLAWSVAVAAIMACDQPPAPVAANPQWRLDSVFVLSEPGYLFALGQGQFAALYSDPPSVLVLDSVGDSVRAFGRAGRGPGEFLMPRGLVVRRDTIQVLDLGNLRLVSFLVDGTPAGTRPISAALAGNMFELLAGDTLLISTQGQYEALAVRRAPSGQILNRYGTATSPAVTFYMMDDIARTIASGRIPDEMKNESVPVEGCLGEVWLIEQTTGQIGRYSREGVLSGTFQLPAAYIDRRTAAFFEKNRHAKPNTYYSLRMISDAVASPEGLWLALVSPDSLPPQLLLIDSTASVKWDVELASLVGNVGFIHGTNRCEDVLLHHYESGLVAHLAHTTE